MANTNISIKNLSSNIIFLKELYISISSQQILRLDDKFSFNELAASNDLKLAIQRYEIAIVRNGDILSGAQSIAFITVPNESGVSEADIIKLSNISVTQPVNLDTMESDIAVNNAKVTNATHTGEVTGASTLTLDPTSISNKSLVTASAGMEVLANDTGILKKINVIDFLGGSLPQVADQVARDSAYPSPANGFQVFNLFQNAIETYNATYDLWLHPGIVVGVEDTTIQSVTIRKIAFISPTAALVSGQEFPIADFPASSGERNVTNGVIIRLGASITGTQRYIAIAHHGKYYVDFSSPVIIGNSVYSTTNTTGLAISGTFSQTGTIGQAIENSGSNPSFPSSVLVSLQNKN
jgi:hypothetical protein